MNPPVEAPASRHRRSPTATANRDERRVELLAPAGDEPPCGRRRRRPAPSRRRGSTASSAGRPRTRTSPRRTARLRLGPARREPSADELRVEPAADHRSVRLVRPPWRRPSRPAASPTNAAPAVAAGRASAGTPWPSRARGRACAAPRPRRVRPRRAASAAPGPRRGRALMALAVAGRPLDQVLRQPSTTWSVPSPFISDRASACAFDGRHHAERSLPSSSASFQHGSTPPAARAIGRCRAAGDRADSDPSARIRPAIDDRRGASPSVLVVGSPACSRSEPRDADDPAPRSQPDASVPDPHDRPARREHPHLLALAAVVRDGGGAVHVLPVQCGDPLRGHAPGDPRGGRTPTRGPRSTRTSGPGAGSDDPGLPPARSAPTRAGSLSIFVAMFLHGGIAAHRREHAVPVGLRQQRRGPSRATSSIRCST